MTRLQEEWDARAGLWDRQADDPRSFFTTRAAAVEAFVGTHVPAGAALDVGCGAGNLSAGLARRGFEVYGCDISAPMIARAITRVSRVDPAAADRFRVSGGVALPFDRPFDVITAIDVLIYVPDYAAFVRVLDRALAPGGTLVLSCTNAVSLYTAWTIGGLLRRPRLSRRWAATLRNLVRTGLWSGGWLDDTSGQRHSAASFDRLLRDCGFETVAAFDLFHHPRWDRHALDRGRITARLARGLGWNHIGLYRRRSPSPGTRR